MLDTNHDGVLSKQEFQAILNYNKSLKFNEADMQLFVFNSKKYILAKFKNNKFEYI